MKKVAFSLFALVFATIVLSCKNENKSLSTENNLAVEDTLANTEPDHLYVTAFSGLTLREHNNINSEKLAVMIYGTKVKILNAEKDITMEVGGIKGGMDEVEYNQKTGFAFNGYMSKFFPPEEDISAKSYAEELKKLFPKVTYSEANSGSASNPTHTETLLLPTEKWHEAFFVAKQLFDMPNEFAFPNPKGSNDETVKDSKPKKNSWTSELHISRTNNELKKIEYVYRTEGFGNTVIVTQEGDFMKLKKTEVAD